MGFRPMVSALLRNKTGPLLVALQIAFTLAIVINALFIILQRVEKMNRATGIDVAVRDLGYRWGSTKGSSHINIHWATLQLAPSLIDYVIVHELAHLKELNHTDRYWSEVARVMPDYERRREVLLTAGTKVWADRA